MSRGGLAAARNGEKAKRFLRDAVYGLLSGPRLHGALDSLGPLDGAPCSSSLSRTRRSRVRFQSKLVALQSFSAVYYLSKATHL